MTATSSMGWRRARDRTASRSERCPEPRAVAALPLGRLWGKLFNIVLLLGFAATASAAKIPAGKDELRKLVCLPPLNFTVTVVTVRGRLRWQQELADPQAVAKLQQEMRGDATDALRLLQLGQLLEDAGLTNQAAINYSNAAWAFRQQIESHLKNGQLLSQLGEALASTGQQVEAESMLRRAVTISAKDPLCWTQLGLFLNDNSRAAVYPAVTPAELQESPVLLATKYKPSAEQFERAERLARESMECFERAISLTPKDPAGFEGRACNALSKGFLKTLKEQMGAPDPNRLILALSPFNPECLPDFHRAAELAPEDPSLLAAVAFIETMGAVMWQTLTQHRSAQAPEKLWDALKPAQAKSVQKAMDQLAGLAESPSKDKAARAAMFLGLLQSVVMSDKAGAEARLRRAVALNPKNPQAWEALMVTLGEENLNEKEVEAGESLVKAIDSSRSHLCLAKAQEKLNHWDKVLEQAQAAVKASSNDLTAKLAVASALLRLNGKDLQQVSAFLLGPGKEDFNQADTALRAHALFLCGLLLALDDHPEQARPLLQLVLKLDPNHDEAKKALAIIESWK